MKEGVVITTLANLPTEFFLNLIISFGFILLIAIALYLISKRFDLVPYSVLLVLVGVLVSSLDLEFLHAFRLTPELLLYVFLPILLYESAVSFNLRQFKEVSVFALVLASAGLIITAAILAVPFNILLGVGITDSFLFGVVIASTDPIAVLAIFKKVGVPRRLALIVDGESILNDGVSIIMFKIVGSVVVGGSLATRDIIPTVLPSAAISIPFSFISSILIGCVMGWVFARLIASIKNDKSAEILLTIILANITFLVTDHLKIHIGDLELASSGVIAVLTAGLVMGNYGATKISPSVRESMHDIWEMLGFVSISIVFFLIGLEMNVIEYFNEWHNILIMSVVLFLARSIAVYLLGFFNNIFSRQKISTAWLHIINWGGLRGALPLMVILILPDTYAHKELFLNIALGIVFLSLILFATTTPSIIRLVGEGKRGIDHLVETEITRLLILRAIQEKVQNLWEKDEIGKEVYTIELKKIKKLQEKAKQKFTFWLSSETPDKYNVEAEKILQKYCLAIEKAAYRSLYNKEVISEGVFQELTNGIDLQIDLVKEGLDPYYERKKLEYGHYYHTLPEFLYNNKIIGKILGISRNRNTVFEYMFHKARELGNEDVLEELHRFKENRLFPNGKILRKLEETYNKHFKNNKRKAEAFSSQDPWFIKQLQHTFSQQECLDLEHKLIEKLGENEMLESSELDDLNMIFK